MSVSCKSFKILVLAAVIALVPMLSFAQAAGGNLILATGGTSGTYYPFGGAMAQIWNKSIDKMNVTAQATGASKENLRLVGRGEADLAIVQNDVMDYAFKGIELFKDEKIEGFRTIATLYPEVIQIVADPAAGINSIADLRGKRVSLGDAGSGTVLNAQQILETYGITLKDIKAAYLSFKESGSALKDKQLDAFFVTAGVPNAAIQEVSTLGAVKILSVDAAAVTKLIEKYKFYAKVTIPAGSYNGMTAAVPTVAVKATLVARADLPDAMAYAITKTLFEKQAELASAHAKGKELSLKGAVEGVSVDFHPGALKYYKEKGVK